MKVVNQSEVLEENWNDEDQLGLATMLEYVSALDRRVIMAEDD